MASESDSSARLITRIGSRAWSTGCATRVAVTVISLSDAPESGSVCAAPAPAVRTRNTPAANTPLRKLAVIGNSPRHARPHGMLGPVAEVWRVEAFASAQRHGRRPAPSAPRFDARPVSGLTSCHARHGGHGHLPKPEGSVVAASTKRLTVVRLDHRCGGSV